MTARAPAPKKVEITKDKEVCALKPHFDEDLIVGSNGGIANAVVIVKGAKGELKPTNVEFDQKGCDYVPHVLAFPAGSTVDIINSDGILHNIHTYSTVNPSFNMAQPKFKKEIEEKVEKPEVIKVTCDAHGWMHGWWVATDTPYFAVTDDKGNYTIKDVPAGNYTVEVWQEKLGTAGSEASRRERRRDGDDELLAEAEELSREVFASSAGTGPERSGPRFSFFTFAWIDFICRVRVCAYAEKT